MRLIDIFLKVTSSWMLGNTYPMLCHFPKNIAQTFFVRHAYSARERTHNWNVKHGCFRVRLKHRPSVPQFAEHRYIIYLCHTALSLPKNLELHLQFARVSRWHARYTAHHLCIFYHICFVYLCLLAYQTVQAQCYISIWYHTLCTGCGVFSVAHTTPFWTECVLFSFCSMFLSASSTPHPPRVYEKQNIRQTDHRNSNACSCSSCVNVHVHLRHENGVSWRRFTWRRMFDFWLNVAGHSGHFKGRSVTCENREAKTLLFFQSSHSTEVPLYVSPWSLVFVMFHRFPLFRSELFGIKILKVPETLGVNVHMHKGISRFVKGLFTHPVL